MIATAPIIWFDQIDSTNEEARRRAASGQTGPVWIAARAQSAGRGRLGRDWHSPPGNLFVTALFPVPEGVHGALRIPFATALAVRDVCAGCIPEADVRLKWPNDVRVGGRKLAGILVEAGQADGQYWLAVGIGLNVCSAPERLGQPATSLVQEGAVPQLQADHVMDDLRRAMERRVQQARGNFEATRRDWVMYAEGLNALVEAGPVEKRLRGLFIGLAEDGGLRLRLPDGTEQIIRAGEVELIKEVGADASGH